MAKIIVEKSQPLEGEVKISGAKNAVLPILAGALLATEECTLEEIPDLRDVSIMTEIISSLGANVERSDNKMTIKTHEITEFTAPYELTQKMRASFYVLGPLLARYGKARVALPGGCAIGARPVDLHLKGFTALGAKVNLGHGYVETVAEELIGAKIYLDYPSVGATENIMMAATLAKGETTIENAAQEPEIVDLANFLNKMGASIKGAGTDTIRIQGVEKLGGTIHEVIPDRIEAGTYMIAAVATKGKVKVKNVLANHLKPIIAKLKECGASVEVNGDSIDIDARDIELKAVDVTTLPYPGFPTDLQAQFMALLSTANGKATINETVFENRFMHVSELGRMGADISAQGHSASVQGSAQLEGADVEATDLRAGAALIIAGLIAEGETAIHNIYHIDRGYVDVEDKFRNLGAKIKRVE